MTRFLHSSSLHRPSDIPSPASGKNIIVCQNTPHGGCAVTRSWERARLAAHAGDNSKKRDQWQGPSPAQSGPVRPSPLITARSGGCGTSGTAGAGGRASAGREALDGGLVVAAPVDLEPGHEGGPG